jgi:hypothetical protein
MLVSDGEMKLACGLAPSVALNLMQPLHAMIDVEIESSKKLITDKHLANCAEKCHCGLYSDLAQNNQLKNDLYEKAQSLSKKRLVTCAELTAIWLCNDPLLKELQSQAESPTESGL